MHEGVICLVIVSPLLLSFVFLGSLLGRWLFGRMNDRLNLSLIPLTLALLAWDALTPHHYENAVSDTLVIHAPPSQVWAHLAAVPPIPEKPDFWLFRMGLPYPTQATVAGAGVGARRRCVFSHDDVFEERITEWQPDHRLTFDVTSQPRDPEILGHARVLRGRFDLHDNGDGTTTLTGTSWYELYVYPSWYYDIWARSIARQVHVRVMRHIQDLSEQRPLTCWLRCSATFPRLRRVHGLPQTVGYRPARPHPAPAPGAHRAPRGRRAGAAVLARRHHQASTASAASSSSWAGREIGHLHGNGLLDIPFTRALRDEAVASGLARPHHIFPRSAWVSFYLHSDDDVPNALLLLRRNYDRWQALDPDEPGPARCAIIKGDVSPGGKESGMEPWQLWQDMARESEQAARLAEDGGCPRSAASRYYYAAYQAVTALLLYRGLTPPEGREAWSHEDTPLSCRDQLRALDTLAGLGGTTLRVV